MPSTRAPRTFVVVASLVLFAFAAFPAAAAASHSDDWQNAQELSIPDSWDDNNSTATTQGAAEFPPDGEPLTIDGPGYCKDGGFVDTFSTGAVYMEATLWYTVIGTGGPVTLSTADSNFDTLIAVYGPSGSDFRCDDDSGPGTASRLSFNAANGVEYFIQVGGVVGSGDETGSFTLDVLTPPGNDSRAAAQSVSTGTSTPSENFGATTEGGQELTSCGDAPFGATVWFRWTAPATGDAVFTASDAFTDTVLGVYAAGGGRLDCSDDAVGSGTSSRVTYPVQGGQTYDIQVGGYGAGNAADQGVFNIGVEFTVDTDLDNDGSSPPADCNDNNANIKPGVTDVNNGVDDNCDGIVDPDLDADGHLRPPLGADCNDNNPNVHPGATDVRGNRLNEDCSGKPAPFRRIRADVRLRGLAGDVFVVRDFLVQDVPRRGKVSARCTPGCGAGRGASAAGTRRVVGVSKRLRPGSVITVRVTRRGWIGFFQKLTIRSFAAPKYERPMCMNPGSRKPRRRCPGIR